MISLVVFRCQQQVRVRIPILNAEYGPDERAQRVQLGTPRVTSEVWLDEACIYAENEAIDLHPEEDIAAVQKAFAQLDQED